MRSKIKLFMKNYRKEVVIFSILFFVVCIIAIGYSFAALTPVKSIIITSEKSSYEEEEPGSWQVEKSAKWIEKGTAHITFDVDTVLNTSNEATDIIFVLDISGSMIGDKLDRVKSDSTELVNTLLSDSKNRAALITFGTESTIVSGLTNNKVALLEQINNLPISGVTNYYQALINVDTILKNYTKENGRELIVLFLTDGYPNVDTPNQVTEYEYLKEAYPYMTINGIQYEMGDTILKPIKEISDNQFRADMETLSNVLFDASVALVTYDKFQIIDYIDNRYFTLESVDDITVSQGSVKLDEENGKQKITWTIDNFKSGRNAKLDMDIKLKDEYIGKGGIYPTNESEEVISRIANVPDEDVSSTKTPVLADNFKVIYDVNSPADCQVNGGPGELNYSVFDTVSISTEKPSCVGYEFKGWEIINKDITRVNDDYFIMPEKDVVVRAKWSKLNVSKNMDGEIYTTKTIYQMMKSKAVMDNEKSEFVASSSGIDFTKISSDTNGNGIYERAGTENDEYPIYYYRGDVNDNHVKFAGFCWQIVRTTDTGGAKIIYDGVPDSNGACNSSSSNSGISGFFEGGNLNSVGYMQGDYVGYSGELIGEDLWYEFSDPAVLYNNSLSTIDMRNTNYYYSNAIIYNMETGLYSLHNPKKYDWSTDYKDLEGLYTCFSDTQSECSEVAYIVEASDNIYSLSSEDYMGGVGYLIFADGNNAVVAQDSAKLLFGNDVSWDGSQYHLIDTYEVSVANWGDYLDNIRNTYRYSCLSDGSTCSEVNYFVSVINNYAPSINGFSSQNSNRFLVLKNGGTLDEVVNGAFQNVNDSSFKMVIDSWYGENLVEYDDYIEDTVWYNDRKIVGGTLGGKNSAYSTNLAIFASKDRILNGKPSFEINNINDAFTVSSSKGNKNLTYPVAMLTADEIMVAGANSENFNTNFYLYNDNSYFTMTPYFVSVPSSMMSSSSGLWVLSNNGVLINNNYADSVRPVISLGSNVYLVDGDGSSEAPYEVMLEE